MRLAALAALRCVQSFGAGAPLSREGGASATAIEPAPGGGLLLDPNGSRRLDADSLRDGIGCHPSDERWREASP